MEKRMMQIDAHTGEIQEGFVAYIAQKRKNGFTQGWIAMSQNNAFSVLADAKFNGETYRVLMKLLSKVEFENFIVVSQSDIAKELGLATSNFSRALRSLVDAGIILRGPKVGRQGSLKLNPQYGWKGTAKNHITALDDFRKNRKAKP